MRIICPSCETEYEVQASMIPAAGRDVQCSNCMKTWFQSGPTKAETDPKSKRDEPRADAASDQLAPEPRAKQERVERIPSPPPPPFNDDYDDDESEGTPPASVIASRSRSAKLDPKALAVIEEEVSRERNARRAEAGNLETQIDLGIDDTEIESRANAARERMAKQRGSAEVTEEIEDLSTPTDEVVATEPTAKRELLPDIEEINSTLADAPDHDDLDEHMDTMPTRSLKALSHRGFRLGFGLMLMVAALIVMSYVYAPTIAAKVPSMAGTMQSYVTTFDSVRVWLDGSAQDLVNQITKLVGTVNP